MHTWLYPFTRAISQRSSFDKEQGLEASIVRVDSDETIWAVSNELRLPAGGGDGGDFGLSGRGEVYIVGFDLDVEREC